MPAPDESCSNESTKSEVSWHAWYKNEKAGIPVLDECSLLSRALFRGGSKEDHALAWSGLDFVTQNNLDVEDF
jgi:hypothetical protein